MKDMCFILDCEALSRVTRRDRAMAGILAKAHQSGVRVVTSSMTLIEAYHGKVLLSAWDWAMSGIVVEPVTRDVADAGRACGTRAIPWPGPRTSPVFSERGGSPSASPRPLPLVDRFSAGRCPSCGCPWAWPSARPSCGCRPAA
ncbi:hypothetical protein EES43_16875 [Streptomyces sp. ADI96-02]|nr:hypothetical protein EES43_16875 [Streptomyces sp. ADI96-02]